MWMVLKSWIPLVARPYALGAWNDLCLAAQKRDERIRYIILIAFACGVALVCFFGTLRSLEMLEQQRDEVYFPASAPLHLVLFFLWILLYFSGLVASLNTFFLSQDLELFRVSPIAPFRFFWGRFVYTCVQSGWIVLLFGIPILAGYGVSTPEAKTFFFLGPLLLLMFLTIPVSLSIATVMILARLLPARRMREILLILGLLLVLVLVMFSPATSPTASGSDPSAVIISRLVISIPTWFPTSWFTDLLAPVAPMQDTLFLVLRALCGVVACISGSYILYRILYEEALSAAMPSISSGKMTTIQLPAIFRGLSNRIPQQFRAIMTKELRLFSRDPSQLVQLALLLGLTVIYFSQFRAFQVFQRDESPEVIWWKAFLTVSNIFVGGLLVVAICARFVFPSLSLEGRSFPFIQKAPVTIVTILRAKFFFWLIGVSVISCVLFVAGSFALDLSVEMIAFHVLVSWLISYGLVGLAIGIGARRCRFDWAHPSQITASSGNLLYMLLGAMYVFWCLAPVTVIVSFQAFRDQGLEFPWYVWYPAIILSASVIGLGSLIITTRSLKRAAERVEERF